MSRGSEPATDGDIARLRAIMRRLRDPDRGCPWDLEQSFATIAPHTIEEAYEVADAIEREAIDELPDELGDLLLQVIFHAQIAEDEELFGFEDVVRAICEKLIRRHPHIFGGEDGPRTAAEQTETWEAIKASERAGRPEAPASLLDGVPVGMPGLTRAVKLQRRAARAGFDWPDRKAVLAKIVEEAGELAAEIDGDRDRIEAEFGDLLFAVVNLGRHLDVDPETALRRVNAKFTARFRAIEEGLSRRGKTPAEATLDEMEALWQAAKRRAP